MKSSFCEQAERRAWPRFRCGLQATCELAEDAPDPEVCAAEVLALSVNGIGLVVPNQFPRGALLALRLQNVSTSHVVRLSRLIHIRPSGDNWIMGCAFTSPLSDEELQALLA